MRAVAPDIGARAGRAGARLATWCLLAGLAGCAGPGGPAAWDKSFIAKPEMSMSWNALGTRLDQQVYESKEAASGGYGVGGGGCGCN
jgi:hypothetical protein